MREEPIYGSRAALPTHTTRSYGATIASTSVSAASASPSVSASSFNDFLGEEEEDEDDESEESNTISENANYNRNQSISKVILEFFRSQIRKIQALLKILVDVDNIWDSPLSTSHRNTDGNRSTEHKLVVLFWFLVLAFAYALERASFKILVDHAGPFRLFSAEAITIVHASILGIGICISAVRQGSFEIKQLGIPLANVGLMALIDTIQLLFSLLSGSHVTPVLTVIIVQLTIPLTVYMTQLLDRFSLRIYSNSEHSSNANNFSPTTSTAAVTDRISLSTDGEEHYGSPNDQTNSGVTKQHFWGASIIFLAVILGIIPALIHTFYPALLSPYGMTNESAWNTLVFTLSCVPAAASTLYKEHTLTHYKQPVDPNILNFILSVFQFLIAVLISPLLFPLQGLGFSTADSSDNNNSTSIQSFHSWLDVYPSNQVSDNFLDGIKCFQIIGTLDLDDQLHAYPEPARCHLAWGLVVLYALSILMVGIAVDKIVHAGATKIMFRGISAGVILAVGSMYLYENQLRAHNEIGFIMNSFYLAFVVILIIAGSEVYYRVSPPDATFETVYLEVENLYE